MADNEHSSASSKDTSADGNRPADVLDVSEADLLPANSTAPPQRIFNSRWGDETPRPVTASSAFAPAAVVFSAVGFLAAAFSFWWPALVIAPLAFGPGLVFAYLAAIEIRKRGLTGWNSVLLGWGLGYGAVIVWHLFLFSALRPALHVSWQFLGLDIDVLWLVTLVTIGLLHGLLFRIRSAAPIAILGIGALTLATLIAALLMETQRQSRATVHTKRAGDLAVGIHYWMDTGSRLRPRTFGEDPTRQFDPGGTSRPAVDEPTESETNSLPTSLFWVGGIAIVLAAWLGILNWRSRQGPRELFRDTTMVACGSRPNCVSSKASERAKRVDPIHFTCSVEEARQRLLLAVSAQPRCRIEIQQPDYLYATFHSRLLRFVDDAEFRIDEQDRVIHCRSASRVGRSDFGVNRERIEAIRQDFAAKYITLNSKPSAQ